MTKRILALITALLLCLGLFAGCGSQEETKAEAPAATEAKAEAAQEAAPAAEEDDYVMQIMSSPALCSAPLFIAIENGYLEECGVNFEYFNSDSNQWDLMAADKCDISYGLLPTFIQRIANGFEMYVVMGAHYGCINVVATDASGIESITDLKGRTVGIPGSMGSDPAILLQRMLVAYGIGINEVNLQVFNNADLATALQEGHIEAFVSWDPYATVVSQYEGNHLIFDQAKDEMTKDEYCCVFGLRAGFVDEHPEMAKKYCEAMTMACDFISENPVEAAKICYEAGYIADADYEFNGTLLDSYRYETNFADAKASFARVTQDLVDLEIISINKTAEELTDEVFVNVGEIQ